MTALYCLQSSRLFYFSVHYTGHKTHASAVGYIQPENFREKFTMFGPMFGGVGTQNEGSYEVDIQSIKPVGENVPDGSDTKNIIQIQFLNEKGGAVDNCFWLDGVERRKGSTKIKCTGWFPGTGTTPFAKTLKAGEAFWASFPNNTCSLMFSGEVANGEVYTPMGEKFNAVCNPNPTDVDIQTVLPAALDPSDVPDGSDTKNIIQIQFLNEKGGATDNCFWLNGVERRKGSTKIKCTGWYPGTGTTAFSKTLKPGEGIWVSSPNDKISLVFPAAIPAPAAE